MNRYVLAAVVAACFATPALAQQSPVSSGETLRVAVIRANRVQAVRDVTTDEYRGVAVEMSKALAKRERLRWQISALPSAEAVIDALARGEADLGFVPVSTVDGKAAKLTRPYLEVGQTFVVRRDSPIRSLADLDRAGQRIGARPGEPIAVRLRDTLRQASLVELADVSLVEAREMLKDGRIDAFGADRQRLTQSMRGMEDFRLLDENLFKSPQAMAVSARREGALATVETFLVEAKRSGLLRDAVARSGLTGVSITE